MVLIYSKNLFEISTFSPPTSLCSRPQAAIAKVCGTCMLPGPTYAFLLGSPSPPLFLPGGQDLGQVDRLFGPGPCPNSLLEADFGPISRQPPFASLNLARAMASSERPLPVSLVVQWLLPGSCFLRSCPFLGLGSIGWRLFLVLSLPGPFLSRHSLCRCFLGDPLLGGAPADPGHHHRPAQQPVVALLAWPSCPDSLGSCQPPPQACSYSPLPSC